MQAEVSVGGWEHECCGEAIERYQHVRWTCIVTDSGDLVETHHDLEGLRLREVAGTVVYLELVKPDGSRVAITRIPARAGALDPDDDRDTRVFEMHSDEPLDASTGEFIVTLKLDR